MPVLFTSSFFIILYIILIADLLFLHNDWNIVGKNHFFLMTREVNEFHGQISTQIKHMYENKT